MNNSQEIPGLTKTAEDAIHGIRENAEHAKEKLSEYSDVVIRYTRKNPFYAIAGAAGIGFLAGMLMKSRRPYVPSFEKH